MSEYFYNIINTCNWNCSYCIADYTKQLKIKDIPDGSVVHIEGGEPGLVDYNTVVDTIQQFKKKNCELLLNTNGLFLERYPNLIIYFEDIIYHCVENISTRKSFKFYDLSNITYMLVIQEHQIEDAKYYANNYDIPFLYSRDLNVKDKTKYLSFLKYLMNNKLKFHKDSPRFLIGEGNV